MKRFAIGIGMLLFSRGMAFGQTAGEQLSFEVASVKPSRPLPPEQIVQRRMGGPETNDAGHIRWENLTLEYIVEAAYAIRYQQFVTDLKDRSLLTDRYDIAANVPAVATLAQSNIMMRNLLAERFKLAVHHETRLLPVYELVVAKSGLKMKESLEAPAKPVAQGPAQPAGRDRVDADGFPQVQPGQTLAIATVADGHTRVTGRGQPLACPPPRSPAAIPYCDNVFVISVLGSAPGGRIFVDRTGLTGKYDFKLHFQRTPNAGLSATADSGETDVNLFDALEQQLGLKLVDAKEPFDVLIVDHVEKPTEN